MTNIFYYSSWVALPLSERQQLATLFGIAKTSSTHVSGNVIVSDGYAIADVESHITVEALQKFLNSDETSHVELWKMLIAQIHGEKYPETRAEPEKEELAPVALEEEPIAKKRGRPAKPKMIA